MGEITAKRQNINISFQAHKVLRILDATPIIWDDGRELVQMTLAKSDYEEWLKVLVALEDIEYGEVAEKPKVYNHARVQ